MALREWRGGFVASVMAVVVGCGGEGASEREPLVPADPNANPSPGGSGWQAPAAPEAGSPVALHGQLSVRDGDLVDAAGAPVQLKGVSTMWLNWENNYASSKDGMRWLRDNWGLSVVRAAMGIEPANAYLNNPTGMANNARTVVRNAIELGLYVIIDWHDHTAHMHQQQASDYFAAAAQEFGAFPNVFYETYNEPMQVDWTTVVKPYHEAVTAVIRQHDPDNVIILGTPTWSQRVDIAATNPVVGTNLMYTVHFYSCEHRGTQRGQALAARQLGLPIFVTEWGATTANGGTDPNGQVCAEEAQLWHDFMNQESISWTAWKLDDCTDLSCLLRTAAPRTGGWTDEWLNGHGPFVRDRMME
ncbi:MAG TPA: glycoside hydrolase family 5 protein [Polyangiaceae bacterium]|nr:glycoside hydrolase family 5 protein [Polyangiaceae bacterium]